MTQYINFGFKVNPPDLSNPSPSPESWLASKRKADSQSGSTFCCAHDSCVWRVHDSLYDLTPFLNFHPGGKDWLEISRGTDITELFESHHPNIAKARSILKKYRISSSKLPPRNSEYSFNQKGFYSTLRSKAWKVLEKSGTGPTIGMSLLHTSLVSIFLFLLFSSPVLASVSYKDHNIYWLGTAALAGAVLALLMMCSHNFFHQKDNWRMYAFDLSPFSSYDWRITHAYSHHTFPNTSYDYEVSTTANLLNFYPYHFPSLKFLPEKEDNIFFVWLKRAIQFLALQLVFAVAMNLAFTRRLYLLITGGSHFRRESLLPLMLYLVLCVMYYVAESFSCKSRDGFCDARFGSTSEVFIFPLCVLACCYSFASWTFMTISLATGHHHPDCWHDGDKFELIGGTVSDKKGKEQSLDWGLFQLAAVGDRPDIDSSMIVSSVSFGRHTLHHLFPTVDHSKLDLLQSVFEETCDEFSVRFFPPSSLEKEGKTTLTVPSMPTRRFTPFESWVGMWQQLWRMRPSDRNFISWK